MADARARDRVRDRIQAISAVLPDAALMAWLRRDVLDEFAQVIEFDARVWLLTDPDTAVGVAPLADVPCLSELPALIKAKYATPVNRWTVLQQGLSRVGLLLVRRPAAMPGRDVRRAGGLPTTGSRTCCADPR